MDGPELQERLAGAAHDGSVRALSDPFGDFTPQPPSKDPNGFRALAVYDDNHDDVIDAQHASYEQLRIWIDENHDGVSQPGELHTLAELGLADLAQGPSFLRGGPVWQSLSVRRCDQG